MGRVFAAVAVVLVSALSFYSFVVVGWRCNVLEGEVSRSIESVWQIRENYRARPVAEQGLARLEPCLKRCSASANLHMLAGSCLTILGRASAAAEAYREALQFDQRPELYMALGLAQLRAGVPTDVAAGSFVKAAEFGGNQLLREVPDAQARWAAYKTLGSRAEEDLIRRGLRLPNRLENSLFTPGRDTQHRTMTTTEGLTPSAAPSWKLFNSGGTIVSEIVPSERKSGTALRIVTTGPHSGLLQQWPKDRTVGRVRTTAWVFVRRGRVYLGSGDGRPPMSDAFSTKVGQWERLEGINFSCPVSVTVLYAAGPEGADFDVDEITATETKVGPPCEE